MAALVVERAGGNRHEAQSSTLVALQLLGEVGPHGVGPDMHATKLIIVIGWK